MSLFPNTLRFRLKGLGFGLYILSSISSLAAIQTKWYKRDSADIFWEEVMRELDPGMLPQAQIQKTQIESYLEQRKRRKDGSRDQISYHIRAVALDTSPSPDCPTIISFRLPARDHFTEDPIPCAVRILHSENLWSRPWGLPTSASAPYRIDLPNHFLLLNGNPYVGECYAERINIGAFTDKQEFLSIVFVPILSAKGRSWTNTRILIIRTRIRRLWEIAEKFRQELQVLPEMADQGPHSDYLAVFVALRDSQRGSNPPDLRPLIGGNLLQDFNAQHPGTEEIKLVYQLRSQLQLLRLKNLMNTYRDHLQAYLDKPDPGLQDIEELSKAVNEFIKGMKDCMIKTDILRRYRMNLKTRLTLGESNFYKNLKRTRRKHYRQRFKPYASDESADHQILEEEEWKALARIFQRSILILGNLGERSNFGKRIKKGSFFSPGGGVVKIRDTPDGKESAQEYLGDPSVIKIYRREPGHAGAILSAPPQP
jgi:hypothetical protein